MSQTSYSIDMAIANEGQLADLGLKDVVSLLAEEALKNGRMVTLGSAENQAKLPAAAGDITTFAKNMGVTVHAHDKELAADGYALKAAVNVLKKGRIVVKSEDAITVGTSTVNVRYAGTGDKGGFRGTAVASETAVMPNARWVTGCGAGGLAVLELY